MFASDNGGVTSALFATGARSEEERAESGGVALGAKPPASNGKLRGGKGSLHEGGVRVPTIFNWPDKLQPRVVNEPLHMVDVMPTLLALAGGTGAPIIRSTARTFGRRSPTGSVAARGHPDQRRGDSWCDSQGKLEAREDGHPSRQASNFSTWPAIPASRTTSPSSTRKLLRTSKPGSSLTPSSRSRPNGFVPNRNSWALRARPFSIPISTSTMAGCRTRSQCCPRIDRRLNRGAHRLHEHEAA